MTFKKIYIIVLCVIALLGITASCVLFFHGGYDDKILVKLGLKEYEPKTNWSTVSWNSCLAKLGYDADIAFLGDSITSGGNFQDYFEDVELINLGLSGDTLKGMINRASMVKNTSPEKVFIMGGINGLTRHNIKQCIDDYDVLVCKILNDNPEIQIYIQSVLPTSYNQEDAFRNNDTVKAFNAELKKYAEDNGYVYIDLFSLFCKNGELNDEYSVDGVHINAKGYDVWAEAISDFVN